jgi:hypothetical protein
MGFIWNSPPIKMTVVWHFISSISHSLGTASIMSGFPPTKFPRLPAMKPLRAYTPVMINVHGSVLVKLHPITWGAEWSHPWHPCTTGCNASRLSWMIYYKLSCHFALTFVTWEKDLLQAELRAIWWRLINRCSVCCRQLCWWFSDVTQTVLSSQASAFCFLSCLLRVVLT